MTQLPSFSMWSLRLGSGIVLSIALLFTIIALATPGWLVGEDAVSAGLFQIQSDEILINGENLIAANSSLIY